jgi:toxin ParE1/3/4
MRIIWTERALRRLQELHDYIARDQPINARRVIHRLLARTEQLTRQPRSGRTVPEYDDATMRELIDAPYRIVYRIDADTVYVLSVRHGAEQLPESWTAL